MANIKRLSEYNVPIAISVVVSRKTIRSLESTTRFFLDQFSKASVKYVPLTPIGRAVEMDESAFMTKEDISYYNRILKMLKDHYSDRILTDPSGAGVGQKPIRGWSGRCTHMKYGISKTTEATNVPSDLPLERCNSGYGVIVIDPSGRLQPCLRAISFFSELFETVDQNIIMPHIAGLDEDKIGKLAFWDFVTADVDGFDPRVTCALKTAVRVNKRPQGNIVEK